MGRLVLRMLGALRDGLLCRRQRALEQAFPTSIWRIQGPARLRVRTDRGELAGLAGAPAPVPEDRGQ